MLVVPKYEGLDLPVHDPDTFVATDAELKSERFETDVTRDFTEPKIVRAIEIQLRNLSHAPRSAAEMLEMTDRELEIVAELCGALVMEYEWGLYPVDSRDPVWRRYVPAPRGYGGIINLPRDHILVAEVDVIKPASLAAACDDPSDEEVASSHAAIGTGVRDYYTEGEGTYQLFDMRWGSRSSMPKTQQFLLGTPVGSPEGPAQTHLIDIEPRFALTA